MTLINLESFSSIFSISIGSALNIFIATYIHPIFFIGSAPCSQSHSLFLYPPYTQTRWDSPSLAESPPRSPLVPSYYRPWRILKWGVHRGRSRVGRWPTWRWWRGRIAWWGCTSDRNEGWWCDRGILRSSKVYAWWTRAAGIRGHRRNPAVRSCSGRDICWDVTKSPLFWQSSPASSFRVL